MEIVCLLPVAVAFGDDGDRPAPAVAAPGDGRAPLATFDSLDLLRFRFTGGRGQ
jgi:hypothetical protein